MNVNILDHPMILSTLFYPRPAQPGTSHLDYVTDGTIPTDGDVVLGYRLYQKKTDAPVLLYFHGNGEIASDYDGFAPDFQQAGVSLMVVDYRGYGWSSGEPSFSALLSDVDAVVKALPTILKNDIPLLLMGRSLGSVCAIQAAHQYPERFKGLIIESGFSNTLRLLARLGLPTEALTGIPDPIGNLDKIKEIKLPLLVIHGEEDSLIHVNHGQALYDASAAGTKQILRIANAGHNDLLFYGPEQYFSSIAHFVEQVIGTKP